MYYGAMNAGKTAIAISKAHEFSEHGKKVYVYLPNTCWKPEIESRSGLKWPVSDELLGDSHLQIIEDNSVVIVDEGQFLSEEATISLKRMSSTKNVLVFWYGLLTDYARNLFEGTKYALQVADTVREIPCMCNNCDKKAQYNYRITNDQGVVVLNKEKYKSLCFNCFERAVNDGCF